MPIISGPSGAIQPVQMPDMVGNYGRLMQLKQMQQEAPLRQQEMQQQVQAGDMENQERQLRLQDAQKLSAISPKFVQKDASGNVTGYDFNGFFNQAAAAGVSQPTLASMQKSISEASEAKSKATGEQLKNEDTLNKQAFQHLEGLRGQTDPAQRQQLWSAATQWARQNASVLKISPGSLPAQAPDDNGLNAIEATLGMHAQQIADSTAKAGLAKDNAETFKDTAQGNEANVNATLGPQRLDQQKTNEAAQRKQEQQRIGIEGARLNLERQKTNQASGSATAGGPIDWGKTAQKYGMTQGAFDQSAEKFATTGQLPPIGRNANAIAMNRDLMNRAAELHPAANLALNAGNFKASQESLKQVQKTYDMTHAFEQTAEKNMDLLQQTAQNIPELGSKFLNIPARAISSSMIGTENMARFTTALQTAQTEAAKVLNNPNSSGVLSDNARKELQKVIDGNMPVKAMVASLDTLKQDMSNRNTAYQDQINTIQDRIKAGGGGNSSTGNSPGAAGKQRFTVNGRAYDIPANMVDEFKKDHPDAR